MVFPHPVAEPATLGPRTLDCGEDVSASYHGRPGIPGQIRHVKGLV
jgi:hypothetical protein